MCSSSYDLIIPGLYLGDRSSADNSTVLERLGVSALVSLDVTPPSTSLPQLVVRILDTEDEDLLSHLPSLVEFIDKRLKNVETVFVHCVYGVSRSASVVAAYLMQIQGLNLSESLSKIKNMRPSVEPNAGFMKQLSLYEDMNCTLQYNNPRLRLYKFLLNHSILPSEKQVDYKCKSCGRKLKFDILPHSNSEEMEWSRQAMASGEPCRLGIFIESIEGSFVDDKIKCPKCKAKLGRLSLSSRLSCSCGGSLPHGYWINLSLVDAVKSLDLSSLR
uniref:protein-tyrosine-phosphatase n=1 Tax=Caligus rogercresseyi TaxID=217165 RepID=C1BMK8_CALRO|nr:Dual specificity protein phosphatase 12 [Caligus rogercresseyi]